MLQIPPSHVRSCHLRLPCTLPNSGFAILMWVKLLYSRDEEDSPTCELLRVHVPLYPIMQGKRLGQNNRYIGSLEAGLQDLGEQIPYIHSLLDALTLAFKDECTGCAASYNKNDSGHSDTSPPWLTLGEGKPTHTLVPCWLPKPLPPRNECMGCFA